MTHISGLTSTLLIAFDRACPFLEQKTQQAVAYLFNREKPSQRIAYTVAALGLSSSYALQRNHPYLAAGSIVLSLFYLSYASLPKGLFIPPARNPASAAPAA